MHPRGTPQRGGKRELALLDFVRTRGAVHPREVDAHFAHGRVTNYWGGSSSATTYLLERMHYRGLVRVVAPRRGHPHLRSTRRERAARGQGRARRAAGRAGRRRRPQVRAAAGPQPGDAGLAAALRGPAVEGRTEAGAAARTRAPGAREDRRRRLVLAGRRGDPVLLPPTASVFWRRSIRLSGIGAASSSCGAGPTASRRTRPPASASSGTTRCRCSGATTSSAGATSRW